MVVPLHKDTSSCSLSVFFEALRDPCTVFLCYFTFPMFFALVPTGSVGSISAVFGRRNRSDIREGVIHVVTVDMVYYDVGDVYFKRGILRHHNESVKENIGPVGKFRSNTIVLD